MTFGYMDDLRARRCPRLQGEGEGRAIDAAATIAKCTERVMKSHGGHKRAATRSRCSQSLARTHPGARNSERTAVGNATSDWVKAGWWIRPKIASRLWQWLIPPARC